LLAAVSTPEADTRAGNRPDTPTLEAFTPEFAPVRRLLSAEPVLKVDPQRAGDQRTRPRTARQSLTAANPGHLERQSERQPPAAAERHAMPAQPADSPSDRLVLDRSSITRDRLSDWRPDSPASEGRRPSIWSTPSQPEPEPWRQAAEEPVLTPPPRKKPRRVSPAVLWTIVALEAVVIAALLYSTPSPLPPILPVTLESLQAGDTVLVNGRPVGVTPLRLNVEPNVQSIEIQSAAPPVGAVTPVGNDEPSPRNTEPSARDGERGTANEERSAGNRERGAANRESEAETREPAIEQAGARQRSGGFRITSPIEIQVLQGDRVLGSSSDGPIVARAGVHDFDFVNTAFGYRSRHRVEIKTNQIINVTVTPPPGRVSINVTPWAQVWIDGDAVGDTPIANREMPVGEHQVTVRHPRLGAHTEKFIIRPGQLTRVTTTLGQ
jgi:hypothetical protein